MVFFKCKMCGGTVEFEQGATVGVCDSCGTKQTLPRLDDDKKANLYDRANHFRRNNEYDKAMGIYEQILAEDNTDAEAYWSLVLCRYGIEYVEDPATHKRVPTVNRAQYMSVSADEDYKSALKYADAYQRTIYEQEAKTIDEIQKGILEISSKEEPFDIFISYKETDESGRRTPDSVLANDLYHQLTNEGFKVFFSRITLEDKLGTAYEPYIFSALNSAKVMVVIGTKPEYFNAVWVKNEWSRYLALVKKSDGKKMIIPAYRDMDPYDLPEEFSHLQAQDMSKLGFMQDLIRGIKKIVQADEPKPVVKETVVVNGGSANVAPLLKRVFMFLEDSNWQEADEYCEKVLDQDPENAQAYVGKVLAKLRLNNVLDLTDHFIKLYGNKDFDRAIRFAVGQEKKQLSQIKEIADKKWFAKCFSIGVSKYQKQLIIDEEKKQREIDRKNGIYERAVRQMNEATEPDDFAKARDTFKSVPGFKDADALATKAETGRKDLLYDLAVKAMSNNQRKSLLKAIYVFNKIPDWKDSKKQIEICDKRIAEINEQEERERKDKIYQSAVDLMKKDSSSAYEEAIGVFKTIPVWKDVDEQIRFCKQRISEIEEDEKAKAEAKRAEEQAKAEARRIAAIKAEKKRKKMTAITTAVVCACIVFIITLETIIIPSVKYNAAMELYNTSKYSEAASAFETINKYKDSKEKALDSTYCAAIALSEAGNIVESYEIFVSLNGYKDSTDKANSIYDKYTKEKSKVAKVGDSVFFGEYEQDNNTSNGKENIEWLVLAKEDKKALLISKYALDCQQYNSEQTNVTWESCTLRKWLNDTFLNDAFNAKQQDIILTSTVTADKNPSYKTAPGNTTTDKVFLLSINEAEKYFSTDEERKCVPSEYTKANGAYTSSLYTKGGAVTCWWWLRSPGDGQDYAAAAYGDGSVISYGYNVDDADVCVRPAMWVSID